VVAAVRRMRTSTGSGGGSKEIELAETEAIWLAVIVPEAILLAEIEAQETEPILLAMTGTDGGELGTILDELTGRDSERGYYDWKQPAAQGKHLVPPPNPHDGG